MFQVLDGILSTGNATFRSYTFPSQNVEKKQEFKIIKEALLTH